MSKNGKNGLPEVKITCRRKRCGKKFPVKVGENNGYLRTVICPHCGMTNPFSVDENGKVHGPAAV
ncbi:MAG: hypothetical protein Q8M00_02730 [bacterium]|nr:hypothetical protein [bacterium]